MIEVSKTHGLFTPDLHWWTQLSNGEKVFYDHRDDCEPAWLRLKKYVELNKLNIEKIVLQFRSHIEELPANADGYFHVMGIGANLALDEQGSWGGACEELWKFGILNGDNVHIKWWRVPELLVINEVVKNVSDCESHLIRRQF